MIKHYDPTLPIEVLFDQIEEGMEVAKSESFPYNKNRIVKKSYLLVIQTCKYK